MVRRIDYTKTPTQMKLDVVLKSGNRFIITEARRLTVDVDNQVVVIDDELPTEQVVSMSLIAGIYAI